MVGLPWNPFAVERAVLFTRLAPEQCAKRLRN
jgi:hypothetical protein